jgi:osmotically-inducible protein OsmY
MADPRCNATAEEDALEAREPAGYRLSDASIQEQVRRRLARDDGLDDSAIMVEVQGGEVTLKGRVRQCADMQRAEQHACETEGVKLVRNALTLDEAPPDAPAVLGGAKPAGAASKMGKPGYER